MTSPVSTDLLVSSALHLMTHYSAQAGRDGACTQLASVIERHLRAIAALAELNPVLRATCQQLSEQWAAVVDKALPKPQPPGLAGRLSRAVRRAQDFTPSRPRRRMAPS